MHELSLVNSIINIVNDYKIKHKFQKVSSLTLSFGELSCVNEESLKFAFDVLTENTFLQNCNLVFKKIPPKIFCNKCEKESVVKDDFSKCPLCDNNNIFLSGGMEELQLTEMDVD